MRTLRSQYTLEVGLDIANSDSTECLHVVFLIEGMLRHFGMNASVEVDVIPSQSTTSNTGGGGADLPTLPDANTEVHGIEVVLIGARTTSGSTDSSLHGHDNPAHLVNNLHFVQ